MIMVHCFICDVHYAFIAQLDYNPCEIEVAAYMHLASLSFFFLPLFFFFYTLFSLSTRLLLHYSSISASQFWVFLSFFFLWVRRCYLFLFVCLP